MRIGRMAFAFVAAACVVAAAPRFEAGESGAVTRVVDGDTLELDGGLVVRLAQIEAPRVRADDPAGAAAAAALTALVQGKTVQLRYGGLRRDRRGRALAQVFVPQGLMKEPLWVQADLLRQGHAKVHTYADNRAEIAALWSAEREARRARRGLWASPRHQVRFATPEALKGGEGTFQLMEGKVEQASQRGSVLFLNFGQDSETDVTAIVPERAFALWRGGAADLMALQGRTIRVRGFVRMNNGPAVWLDHPEQIEFVVAPSQVAGR